MVIDQDPRYAGEFSSWLEVELNGFSRAATTYERAAQESIPEAASAVISVLQQVWDAHAVLVQQDSRYMISMPLMAFIVANQSAPSVTVEQRLELLERYLRQTAVRYEQQDNESSQLRQTLFNEAIQVLRGQSGGELFSDVYAAAFEAEGESEEPDYEELEAAGGPYAVAYLYDELPEATAAYEGSAPSDRAKDVRLISWDPLDDSEREVLRNLIDERFARTSGNPVAFEADEPHIVDAILKNARAKLS